ncbi:MAG TPA: PilZ domain-containing protein [Candidatus Omnitrophota bacterium]|nr:PilZ domain-containing protein [Candidatus Omnitrophota bacterium]HRZ15120.1 PilZ domain-containing protein [Candidatus Omnitrophota bacterium]
MGYQGVERRKSDRIRANFIVSYRVLDEINNTDITQTKNMSLGGMLLTTSRKFESGMHLAIEIRLPFERNPIMMIGKVIESTEITKDLIYDTRLEFLAIDENHRSIISKTVGYYVNKDKKPTS